MVWQNGNIPWNKDKHLSGFLGKRHSEESKLKMSQNKKGIKWPEESRKKYSEKCKGRIISQQTRDKISRLWKDRYNTDPQYKDRIKRMILKSRSAMAKRKPNNLEIMLGNFLNEILPDEYKFVGNGEVWLGNRNPDFINVNGKKKVIELFGRAVHDPKDELQRINHYKTFGFEALVIWANDLVKNKNIVRERIITFN